jgi:hypothetical protein
MFDVLKGEGSLCFFGGAFRPLRFPKCFNKVALCMVHYWAILRICERSRRRVADGVWVPRKELRS